MRYRLNGVGENLYTGPFEVSAEGTTTIDYWAIDGVGNTEVAKSALVRIDRIAPADYV